MSNLTKVWSAKLEETTGESVEGDSPVSIDKDKKKKKPQKYEALGSAMEGLNNDIAELLASEFILINYEK